MTRDISGQLNPHYAHGEAVKGAETSEYLAWAAMMRRCNTPTTGNYQIYGGRGIRVCERWTVFEDFLADMGRKPSPAHSIDRIDVNGNYEPNNCRWATSTEQARNRRSNRLVILDGREMCMVEACEIRGIPANTVDLRMTRGWSFERAINTPARPYKRKAI
jgi:hypothetical protein